MPPKSVARSGDTSQDIDALVRQVKELGEKIRRQDSVIVKLQKATELHLRTRRRR